MSASVHIDEGQRRRLDGWLDEHGVHGENCEVERVTTGHSNELFRVRRGEQVLALRRPPASPLSPTAHDMVREHRVLQAIAASDAPVPIPRTIGACDDPSVIGAPFMVMEFVDGVVARHGVPEPLASEPPAQLADALVDVLADLHAIDWRAAGLEDLGRPDGFLERQVTRWSSQLDSYRTRPLPAVDEVAAWLTAQPVPSQPAALLHGDYTLVNVLFAPTPPVRIAAVLDWEQATIGDPLVDVGWLLGLWHDRGEPRLHGAEAGVIGLPDAPGMPDRAELAERYARRSGRDLGALPYYCALALFKLACVMEGSYARYTSGRSDDPYFAILEEAVPQLAERALTLIGRS